MARTRIELPRIFPFTCIIPIRITDVNYGGHVGNDTVLTILHEARMQFLQSLGYTEMEFAGCGMIMAGVTIEFKHELFYGDQLTAYVAAGNLSRIGFDIFYKLEKRTGETILPAAFAQTSMICYDYDRKKIVAIPAEASTKIQPPVLGTT